MSRQLEAIQFQCSDRAKNAMSSDLFRVGIRNEAEADEAELLVYGAIGDDWLDENAVTAAGVADFLGENPGKNVRVRINSPGGLVFDGLTIHNALLAHKGRVKVTIEGVAASAATIVAAAGDEVEMYENASYMIHRAWGVAVGNTDEMLETGALLEKLDGQIARTLAARAGKPTSRIANLMRGTVDGTWFTAAEAKEEGLVDSIVSIGRGAKDTVDDSVKASTAHSRARILDEMRSVAERRVMAVLADGDLIHKKMA